MAIMDLAFPLTALYMGPIALWAYFARGRRMSRKRMRMHMAGMEEGARDSLWQGSLSGSHSGAGRVLGGIPAARVVRAHARLVQLPRQPLAAAARHQGADADRLTIFAGKGPLVCDGRASSRLAGPRQCKADDAGCFFVGAEVMAGRRSRTTCSSGVSRSQFVRRL